VSATSSMEDIQLRSNERQALWARMREALELAGLGLRPFDEAAYDSMSARVRELEGELRRLWAIHRWELARLASVVGGFRWWLTR
jgi:hypothetical protein